MNILITGASGFVGSSMIDTLVSLGHGVIGIDKRPGAHCDDFYLHDLRNPWNGPPIDADVCVHLASEVGGFLYNQKMTGLVEINDRINQEVQNIVNAFSIPRLCFFSTINVFEQIPDYRHDKLGKFNQVSPYAVSKAQGEHFFTSHNQDLMVIRPTNIFGKHQDRNHSNVEESHVIPDLLRKIRSESVLNVLGDGSQIRNFVHVNDLSNFVVSNLNLLGQHYVNLRSEITISIGQLARELLAWSGSDLEIVFDGRFMAHELFTIQNFDLSSAIQLGWNPAIRCISDGLEI